MIERLHIDGVFVITPSKFGDDRGFFSETFSKKVLEEAGVVDDFVQDNQSLSVEKGVVRGLHFQTAPHAQDKLVRVTQGSILDIAVDIRHGSPTFGQHVAVELNAENWKQLLVPKGFAHGFCTLTPNTEVQYKVTDYYAPECDMGLAWDDAELEIEWPITVSKAILSDKDKTHPTLKELPDYFIYEG